MIRFVVIFLVVAFAHSFSVRAPTVVHSSSRFSRNSLILSAIDDEKLDFGEKTSTGEGMMVRDMTTGEMKEVKWVDPAMSANTSPFELSWYAWLAILVPGSLYLNDFFHFIPKEGPLAFLNNL